MDLQSDKYYSVAGGIDIVPLVDGNTLFCSDTLTIRIEGEFSRVLVQRILPYLDGRHSLSEIAARLPDMAIDDIRGNLDALARSGVLHMANQSVDPQSVTEQTMAPFLAMLDAFGLSAPEALPALRQLRVAIFGLEGPGAYLAMLLVRCGIGNLLLVDPLPCQPGNLILMPNLAPAAIGQPRQEALATLVRTQGSSTTIRTGSDDDITRERIAALAQDSHMLVGCFDKGFSSTNHWINHASIELGIPAIYAESRGITARIGPLVLPGQAACYMCYRMRSVACEADFDAAMRYEEFLDQQKRPAMHERAVLPIMPPYLASMLALDILKHLLSISQPMLVGKMMEFDALSLQTTTHTVLQKPDCPVCQVKKKWSRVYPLLPELKQNDDPPGDLLAVADQLLSQRTGIVRDFEIVKKDVSEPMQPYVFHAQLANHRFLDKDVSQHLNCSGKGMTLEDARMSTLGEAVERYSAACWDYREITYARRSDLDGDALDPRQLVLYAPGQYEQLPYSPYTDENFIGWVRARSLVTGKYIFVPALGVLMGYEAQIPQEFLYPVTSNGLGAGPTLLDAILAATCELLERDAFIITWFNQLPCQRVDPMSHPDADTRKLCSAYQRRGVEIQLYRLPVDHPCHVFAALAVQAGDRDGPAAVMGLGADLAATAAARKAILEVAQIRPVLRRRMRHPEIRQHLEELADEPKRVTSMDDHDLLYASSKSSHAFDFLTKLPLESFDWKVEDFWSSVDKLQILVDYFHDTGEDLLYYNLTPPDMHTLGLHTVRAILPGFQPIHFGAEELRLGGNRLYELPRRLGFTATRTTPEQLNRDPHPLA